MNGISRLSRRSLCSGMAFSAAATLLVSSPAAATQPPPGAIQGAQILLGEPSALKRMVLGVSLHCGGTRAYFREHGSRLAREVADGKRLILLTHIVRTPRELPVGVELLRLGSAFYPEAFLGTLALSVELDEPVSLPMVKEYVAMKGWDVVQGKEHTKDFLAALLATRRAYEVELGVKKTPFVQEG